MTERRRSTAKERSLATAKRLVVKIGSALLVDQESGDIRRKWLEAVCDDVAALRKNGTEVVLVSSGAIAVGRRRLGLETGQLRLEENRPPPQPARSGWHMPIKRRSRVTASLARRCC